MSSWLAVTCLGTSGLYASGLGIWSFLHPGWHSIRVETAWIVFAFVVLLTLASAMSGGAPTAASGHQRAAPHMTLSLIALSAAGFVYYRALTLGYLSDDFVLLGRDMGTSGWVNGDSVVFRPLPLFLFHLADRVPGGQGPFLLHLLNLGLHLACAWLVWRIATRLDVPTSVAFLAMLLFLVFPASVEAVAWCSGLQDVLATIAILLFALLTVQGWPAWTLLAALAIGLASKESAVVAPLLAALAVWAAPRHPLSKSTRAGLIVALVVVVAFSLWRLQTAGPTFAASPSRYLLKKVASNAYSTLALPLTDAALRHWAFWGMFMAVLMASAGASVMLLRDRAQQARAMLATLVWPIVAILPAYSIFFVAGNLEGGRLLYTASAGWAIAFAMTESTFRAVPRLVMRGVLAVVAGVWCLASHGQVLEWQHASVVREQVLMGVDALPMAGCTGVNLIGVPDNVGGAYVFRNGLHEALKRRGREYVQDAAGCRFVWNGAGFVPEN